MKTRDQTSQWVSGFEVNHKVKLTYVQRQVLIKQLQRSYAAGVFAGARAARKEERTQP